MTNIDYTEIDDLCRESIRYLNEVLNIPTKFCCEGKSQLTDRHSATGYISFSTSDASFDLCKYLCINLQPQVNGIRAMIEFNVPNAHIIIYFRPVVYSSGPFKVVGKERNKEVWNIIESTIKSYK